MGGLVAQVLSLRSAEVVSISCIPVCLLTLDTLRASVHLEVHSSQTTATLLSMVCTHALKATIASAHFFGLFID